MNERISDLITKTDADAEKNTTTDQHAEFLGKKVEDSTGEEEGGGSDDHWFSSESSGEIGSA